MRYILTTAIIYLLALSCHAQDKKLYLVPDSAKGIKISNIVEEIILVPLETTGASYFNNMADFLITPDRLIFTDNEANSILIFDKQGKFLYKFKKKKYKIGSLRYDYAKNALFFGSMNKNYTIPEKKRYEMIKKPGKRDFSKYINMEYLHLNAGENYRIEKLNVLPYMLGNFYYAGKGNFFQLNSRYNSLEKDTVRYHFNIYENNKIVKSYFPFLNLPKLAIDYDDIGINIDRTLNDSTYYIHKNYDNNIYKLVNDSLQLAYNFVFPAANTMHQDYFTTRFKNNIDYTAYKNKNTKVVNNFFNIIDLKDVLLFGINDNSWNYRKFVFNKNSSTIYDLGKATSDSVTYYLPSSIFMRMNNYDEDYIYTFISAPDLLKEKANILARFKDSQPPKNLVAVLNNLTKFSNAVIIKLKLKTNITK